MTIILFLNVNDNIYLTSGQSEAYTERKLSPAHYKRLDNTEYTAKLVETGSVRDHISI